MKIISDVEIQHCGNVYSSDAEKDKSILSISVFG